MTQAVQTQPQGQGQGQAAQAAQSGRSAQDNRALVPRVDVLEDQGQGRRALEG